MTEKRTTKPPHEPTGATLTAKQEAFCQAIADGMTQADAYRTAYNAVNMKPSTVQENACRMMADSKIGKYMIGMSVPPKMTEQVARAVCSQWLGVEYDQTN